MTTTAINLTQQEQKSPDQRGSVEEYLGGFLLAVMVVVIFVQVIARYVFGNSFAWSEELARYAFIWLIFLTLGAVVRNVQHVTIDAIVIRLAPGVRKVWEQVLQVIVFALNLLLIIYGTILVVRMAGLGQTSAALQLPMWVVYAAMPVGMLLASFRAVQASMRIWRQNPYSGVDQQGLETDRAAELASAERED